MDWLKELLGTAYTEELANKFKAEIPKHFVAKEQYNKKVEEIKVKDTQIADSNTQLEKVNGDLKAIQEKAGKYEELKTDFEKVNTEYTEYKSGQEKRLLEIKKSSALEKALINSKASSDAVDLLLKDFSLDKIEINEDGTIKDVDTHINSIKEKRPNLFEKVSVEGGKPNTGNSLNGKSREELSKMSDDEYYNHLKTQNGGNK